MQFLVFRELQSITVLFLIQDSYKSWSSRFVSLKVCGRFCISDSVSFLSKVSFSFRKKHEPFEGVYMIPEMKFIQTEISFCHEKSSVYRSSYCGRNEIKFTFVLVFWSTIFVFMKYSHVQMFPSEWFNFGVVFWWHLSPEMNFHFCQNDRNEITPAMSFISGYFQETVIRYWPGTQLKTFCFTQTEISYKHPLWLENVIILFKIRIIATVHMLLLQDLWFLSCNKNF